MRDSIFVERTIAAMDGGGLKVSLEQTMVRSVVRRAPYILVVVVVGATQDTAPSQSSLLTSIFLRSSLPEKYDGIIMFNQSELPKHSPKSSFVGPTVSSQKTKRSGRGASAYAVHTASTSGVKVSWDCPVSL